MSAKKNIKKYNHYVPQFLLRQFSNNRKSVGMYIKESNKYIKTASISNVAGENFLYGKTNELEDILAEIEGAWSTVINKINSSQIKYKLNKSERELLYTFFTISEARTLEMITGTESTIIETLKNGFIYGKAFGLEDYSQFTYNEINNLESNIRVNLSRIAIETIRSAAELSNNLRDLKIIIIKNETALPFIIGDCPVVKYNKYLRDCININGYAWNQKGIIALVPISNEKAIMIFDAKIYKLIKCQRREVIIQDIDAINEINKLIFLQSEKYVFFCNNIQKEYLDTLNKIEFKPLKLNFSLLLISCFSPKSVKNNIEFSFLRMKTTPLFGQYHNNRDYYRKKLLRSMCPTRKEYLEDQKIDKNKLFQNIKKYLDKEKNNDNR